MKTFIRIFLLFAVIAFLLFGSAYYVVFYPNTQVSDDGIIYIRKGQSFGELLDTLHEKNYLRNSTTFTKVAEVKKYPQMIKPGKYKIESGISNNRLVNKLRSGDQLSVNFTFNNMRTLEPLASLLSSQLQVDSTEFMNLVHDPEFLDSLGFSKENIIGMFIPNTYQVYWGTDARKFIERMHKEFNSFWNGSRSEEARKIGLSPSDVMILASIIEEETIKPEEYSVIAGVYINRLKRNIPLSACPTLKFAWNDFTLTRILNKHMEIDSPYNTYKYRGLPPGPVRMASVQVIDAVLNFQKHDFLYFCAKSDFSGGHHFSKTLRQHNKYAAEYHKALNRRGIY